MEQKNFFLAIALSVGFLFVWSVFVVPRFTPKPIATPPEGTPPPQTAAQVAAKPAEMTPATPPAATSASDVFMRDDRSSVAMSPRGGAIRSWKLKLKGQEIDLVEKPDAAPLPLATFPDKDFKVTVQDSRAVMDGVVAPGVRLVKTLTLSPLGFLNDVTLRFENSTNRPVEIKDWEWGWGPGLGTTPSEQKENDGLIRALSMGKLKATVHKPGEIPEAGQWSAIDNRYFLVAFLPPTTAKPRLVVSGTKGDTRVTLRDTTTVPARGSLELRYQLYVGPKGYTQLKGYGKELEHAVDFGFFGFLGKLLLDVLYKLKGWTGNYGWSIVILTVLLQFLLLPLTLKSFKATYAMKKLQPQIAEIQKKFKGDPKRLNIEMMNVYKKSGTNPFGGCLPMLLQIPIFWALFTMLRNAYELRGAPWIFWIKDLSAADPWHVLPIVMGAGMFLQQRLAGAVTDPTQRQMMFIMPIMFTVMFFNFSSGLVLYWLTNSIVTMVFQWVYQKRTEEAQAR